MDEVCCFFLFEPIDWISPSGEAVFFWYCHLSPQQSSSRRLELIYFFAPMILAHWACCRSRQRRRSLSLSHKNPGIGYYGEDFSAVAVLEGSASNSSSDCWAVAPPSLLPFEFSLTVRFRDGAFGLNSEIREQASEGQPSAPI